MIYERQMPTKPSTFQRIIERSHLAHVTWQNCLTTYMHLTRCAFLAASEVYQRDAGMFFVEVRVTMIQDQKDSVFFLAFGSDVLFPIIFKVWDNEGFRFFIVEVVPSPTPDPSDEKPPYQCELSETSISIHGVNKCPSAKVGCTVC